MKYRILQVFWILTIILAPIFVISNKIVDTADRLLVVLALLVVIPIILFVSYEVIIIIESCLIAWIFQNDEHTPITNFLKMIFCLPLYIQERIEKKEIEKKEEIKLVNKILHENGIVDKNGKIV